MSQLDSTNQAAPTRPRAKRRGTVIVLALAVLAILAIAAVAYVSVVRIDRESSAAVARQANYEQQVNAVVGHIGSLIAADNFGNKVVTNATPKTLPGDIRVWPRAFEDSESWDYPSSDIFWRNPATTTEDDPLNPRDTNVNRRVARPDDAWLASLDPRWNYANLDDTRYWPQITNLRSAYTWNQRQRVWERGDGRYVDLLQWFLQSRNGRANAAINLNEEGDGNNPMGPAFGYDDGTSNRNTGVFDKQTAELDLGPAPEFPRVLNPSDERMWVDTDGDLRPDARWQQLDSLGNLYGLNWVVAARIIDASALVNVQTAIEFPYESTATLPTAGRTFTDIMGTGKTPADVDLLRLLSYSSIVYPGNINVRPNVYDADVRINQIDRQFRDHLELSLGTQSVINDLSQVNGTPPDDPAFQDTRNQYVPWQRANPLTRTQREALFSYATSTIDRPVSSVATTYPRRDMLDLFTYAGTNNSSILSKLEQRIDGPEGNQGYLPDPDAANAPDAFGPMRAAERASEVRRFDSGSSANPPEPSVQRIKLDIRRLLTMVSGVGQISPVPVLNDAVRNRADSFDSQYSQKKIRFSELVGLSPGVKKDQELVQRVFGSFVWALAPLATNQPLAPGVPQPATGGAAVATAFAHYGAGTDGPAIGWKMEIGSSIDPGASYAVLRAAALTVNTIDAMDRVQPQGTVSPREKPTIMRLWNNVDLDTLLSQDPTLDNSFGFEVGTRLTQGDIPANLLPQDYLGGTNAGITLYGMDRQPFLKEVHTTAVYQTVFGTYAATPTIDPADRAQQVGCIVAVELGNPWPEGIDLSDYEVRIGNGTTTLTLDLAAVSTGTQTIAPAGSLTLYWVTPGANAGDDPGNPAFGTTFREFVGAVGGTGWGQYVVSGIDVKLAPEALKINGNTFDPSTDNFVVFQGFGGATNVPVVLVRKATGVDGPVSSTEFVVDRMSPPSSGDPFPGPLNGTIALDLLAVPGYGTPETNGAGRVAVSSSLHRHDQNAKGFPAYVVERRESNKSVHFQPASPAAYAVDMVQMWLNGDPIPTADVLANNFPTDTVLIDKPKGEFEIPGGASGLPAFQLFVPDRPLEYLSELLLVTPFCNMYVHRDLSGTPVPAAPDVTVAWDITPGNKQPWITFSEQLGKQYELNYTNQPNQAADNPYFAQIDPIRYTLGSASMLGLGTDVPDALTIPLGLRIVEPFDALTPATDATLIQGRINVNTAPAEVIACLPLVAPQFNVPAAGSGVGGMNSVTNAIDPVNGAPNVVSRLQTLLTYRDRVSPNNDPNGSLTLVQPAGLTNLAGLRGSIGRVYSDPQTTRGFITPAELAVLQPWEFPATGQLDPTSAGAGTAERYWAQLGGDAVNAGGGTLGAPTQVDSYRPYTGNGDGGSWITDPTDDPEERLAIYRAISNIVSTRSDVFVAWFVLRGYDPDIIEAISVPGGNSPTLQQARDAMNDPLNGFRATYESRWLVVYDRSNCVKPTDRPKILMQVELPNAKP